MSYSICFGADIVPTDSNFDSFIAGELDKLIDEKLKEKIFECTYRVFNLELALYDGDSPIIKAGPNIKAPTETIKGIKKFKPSLLTLANNHTRDHGVKGLISTIDLLNKNNVNHIGAGKTLEEASAPYIFEENGVKTGIYTCAEHEFTIVDDHTPGANPFDPYESLDHIADLKAKCDYVVVLYHGGKEHYRYPSPNLQKRCRKMVEKGADLVICQHTHCISCPEEYKGGTIVYGQGNFLFDLVDIETWLTSILVRAEFGEKMTISYIPICKDGAAVRHATEEEAKEIMDGFFSRGEEIKKEGFIKENFLKEAKKELSFRLRVIAGGRDELTPEYLDSYTIKAFVGIYNYLKCEPHVEVIETAVWDAIEKVNADC